MKAFITRIILLSLAGWAGCREADTTGPGARPEGSGTYIVNEGGFGGGGSLSFFDPSDGSVSHDVVRGAPSWLFPNDILMHGGRMYVAVNGGDFVSILDPRADSSIGEIRFAPGSGPGLLAAEGERIFSANYDGTISLIDPAGDSLRKTSGRVVGFPGAILAWGGRVFVSDLGSWPDTGANVVVLEGSTLSVIDSVTTGGGMAGLALARGKIYAGAAVSRKIFRFDPLTLQVEDSVRLDASPGDLASDGASLFVLTPDAVERISLGTFAPDSSPTIVRTAGLFNYAMALDAASGELYVSTITTGGGSGEVGRFNTAGAPLSTPFNAGIFPGAFGFYRPAGR